MTYTKTLWIDDQAPAIDATNLNHIEEGIASATMAVDNVLTGSVVVPLAGHATTADSLTTPIASAPIGLVEMFAGINVPVNYLECNGQLLPRTHPLFAVLSTYWGNGDGVTTFAIPDMRGVFPRGWDHGRGLDSGRGFGSYQDDTVQEHTHAYNKTGGGGPVVTNGYYSLDAEASTSGVRGARVSGETRGKNNAIMFIIKAS
jgi:microcystin-dependent protein